MMIGYATDGKLRRKQKDIALGQSTLRAPNQVKFVDRLESTDAGTSPASSVIAKLSPNLIHEESSLTFSEESREHEFKCDSNKHFDSIQ